jgi:integrase
MGLGGSNPVRSTTCLPYWTAHLARWFGNDRAIDITADRVRAYITERQNEGAKPASINRELNCLRRAFNLAIRADRLSRAPHIERLPENNARQGFLDPADFHRLLAALPPHLQDPVGFLYFSGWRPGERPDQFLTAIIS